MFVFEQYLAQVERDIYVIKAENRIRLVDLIINRLNKSRINCKKVYNDLPEKQAQCENSIQHSIDSLKKTKIKITNRLSVFKVKQNKKFINKKRRVASQ